MSRFLVFRTRSHAVLLFALIWSLSIPQATQAQDMTPAEREAIEAAGLAFVEAVNAPAAERVGRIQADAFLHLRQRGEERLLAFLARLQEDFGTLAFHHAEVVSFGQGEQVRHILHVYAQAVNQQWKDFQFRLEPTPPYRIHQLGFIADVAEPVYLPNGAITAESTLNWLNGYIDKLVEDNDLFGSILIAQGNTPLLERYYGFEDVERTRPVTEHTHFNLGSGNKLLTATALAQLVEAGSLRYDEPIATFFPDFPDVAAADRITVHHLLTHTSGIGEYWTNATEAELNTLSDPQHQILPFIYAAGIDFPTGSAFAYSNSNFILAGLIVEQVSGMDYYAYIRQHVYEPSGMMASGSFDPASDRSHLAQPLTGDPRSWVPANPGNRGTSAGGGFSTVQDMLAFTRAWTDGTLVKPETWETMTASKTSDLPDALDYGYGIIRSQSQDDTYLGHGGTSYGVNFALAYFPRSDITLVIFCNQDNGAYDDLRRNTIKLITGER